MRWTSFSVAMYLAGGLTACLPPAPRTPNGTTVSTPEPAAPLAPATAIAALSCDDIKAAIQLGSSKEQGIGHEIPGSGTDYGEDYFTRHVMPNAHFCWVTEFDFDGGGSEEYTCQWPQPDQTTAIAVAQQIAAKVDACLPDLNAIPANQTREAGPRPRGQWGRALSAADNGKSVGVFVTDDAYKSAYPVPAPADAESEPSEDDPPPRRAESPQVPAAPPGPFVRFHVLDTVTTCEAFGGELKSAVWMLREPPKPEDPRGVDGNRTFLSPFDFDSGWPNEIDPYAICLGGWKRRTLDRAEFNPTAEFLSGIEFVGAVGDAPVSVHLYEQNLERNLKVVWLEVQLR